MEKELKIIEVPASGKPNWGGGAYCITFVYSKHNGNFILKGYVDEVEKYLKNNYTHYFANHTLWFRYGFRTIWKFWNRKYYISAPDRVRNRHRTTQYKWRVTSFSPNRADDLEFRRFPKRWIKEFDNLK